MGDEALDAWVTRRANREPVQVILAETWFRNVRLATAPGVFIPRPETEIVAGLAIAAAASAWPDPKVIEACTGSGAIICALLTEVPGVHVVATELDGAAAALARDNVASALRSEAGCQLAEGATGEVRQGSLLDPVDQDWCGHVDVLVANPPYLPASDVGTWDPEVASQDPVAALVGGVHGNEIVDELARLAMTWLVPGGTLVLELDPRLADDAKHHAEQVGLVDVRIAGDLTGRDRALVARRPA
ncbi:MAG: release factor glutamine methyltransferase [Glaciecola sp.]